MEASITCSLFFFGRPRKDGEEEASPRPSPEDDDEEAAAGKDEAKMRVLNRSVLLLVAAGLSALANGSAEAKSPLEYEREFADWLSRHRLTFSDALEYVRRLENYIANDLYIMEQNLESAFSGVKLAHNQYSHLSHDEFRERFLGFEMPDGYLEARLAARQDLTDTLRDVQVPESVDWTEKGAVTPVKNQAMCGYVRTASLVSLFSALRLTIFTVLNAQIVLGVLGDGGGRGSRVRGERQTGERVGAGAGGLRPQRRHGLQRRAHGPRVLLD